MEALQQIDDWRQAARTSTILYCESDDRLKQNAKDMSEHRKNKKEAKERLLELLKTTNAPGFNIAERGYHVSLANRRGANANLLARGEPMQTCSGAAVWSGAGVLGRTFLSF